MNTRFHIAIEGPIGVGKTTLARILQQEMGGQLLLEVFEENPFLSDFYADRARYAFQTQIFFLLSRYRQQNEVISQLLRKDGLVSDYLFAKDRLFAHLNLSGDELLVYERMHDALAESIPVPQLVVNLWANTDGLMNRIAIRDRSFERSMSRQYIDDLRIAYERFFVDFDQAPILNIDTSDLNFVASQDDRRDIVNLIRNTLEKGAYQQVLPDVSPSMSSGSAPILRTSARRLGDFQQFHLILDQEKDFVVDLYLDFMLLTEEVGELGRELAQLWAARIKNEEDVAAGMDASDPLDERRQSLKNELADVLAYVIKIANDAGIDLEDAYVDKMDQNWRRNWPAPGTQAQ
ncbi:MAG: deoxynucleoside kinase [Chloroflexota bacterium]|nr:deoxynucleoside kinase [Chloroflexota bacterium]